MPTGALPLMPTGALPLMPTGALPLMPTAPQTSAAPPASGAAAFGLDQGVQWQPHLPQQADYHYLQSLQLPLQQQQHKNQKRQDYHMQLQQAAAAAAAEAGRAAVAVAAAAGASAASQSDTHSSVLSSGGRHSHRSAHSSAPSTALSSLARSASSRASFTAAHVAGVGPERPLHVDGLLPGPMSGAREGMLKQQLMALAEAMAVDDSVRGACVRWGVGGGGDGGMVRWRQFMRQVRREAAAGGDTLQRIAFHALEALEARMDGTALVRAHTPMNVTVEDSMAALGHGGEHGVPAFMHLANTAAVHEVVRAFTHNPHPPAHAHAHAPPLQPAPPPAATSPFAGQSAQRRRLHIIAIGFYGGPHWINILMRLATHLSNPPLFPDTANDLLPSGIPAGEAGAAPGAADDDAIGAQGEAGAFGAGSSGGGATAAGASGGGSSRFTSAAPFPTFVSPHVKVTAIDFGVVKVEEYPTGLVHLGKEYLEQVASMLDLPLTFHGIETTPQNFHPSLVEVEPGEEIVVLANWGLMVFPDDTIDNDVDANGPFFLSRFHASFLNFAALVESFDCSMPHAATPRFVAETILARDFLNGVACEGMNRYVRSERLGMWVHRMKAVGLEAVPIGPDTVAAGREATEGRDKRFRLEVHAETGALQLSWRGVPLIFVAAWK
ncbi:unnamed protein product [Closterium sp. Naga37s-1]|nr:unnamed protein product [Closterium sp. Naga37s-1]